MSDAPSPRTTRYGLNCVYDPVTGMPVISNPAGSSASLSKGARRGGESPPANPETTTGDPDLDRMRDDPAVAAIADLYGERVGCHGHHSVFNSCCCMLVGLEILKTVERSKHHVALWNQRIELWELLREARNTRAADIVPNGWAERVDQEFAKNGV